MLSFIMYLETAILLFHFFKNNDSDYEYSQAIVNTPLTNDQLAIELQYVATK